MTDSQQPQRKPSENKVAFWLSHCEWTRSEIAAILLQAPIAWILSDSLAPQWSVILPIIAAYLMIHRNYRTFCLRQFERPQQQKRATPKEQQQTPVQESQPQAERHQSQQQPAPKQGENSQTHQQPADDQNQSNDGSAPKSDDQYSPEQTDDTVDVSDPGFEDNPSVSYELGDSISGAPPIKETLESAASSVQTGNADFRSILLFGDDAYDKRAFFEEADMYDSYWIKQFEINQVRPACVYEAPGADDELIVGMADSLEWFTPFNATDGEIAPQRRERFDELAAVLEDRPEDTIVIGLYNGGEVPGEIATLFDDIVAVEYMSRSQRRGVIMSALQAHDESLPKKDVGHAVDWLFGFEPTEIRTIVEVAAKEATADGRPLELHDIERVAEEGL